MFRKNIFYSDHGTYYHEDDRDKLNELKMPDINADIKGKVGFAKCRRK